MIISKNSKSIAFINSILINFVLLVFIIMSIIGLVREKSYDWIIGLVVGLVLLIFLDTILFINRKNVLSITKITYDCVIVEYCKKIIKRIDLNDVVLVVVVNNTIYLSKKIPTEISHRNINKCIFSNDAVSFKIDFEIINFIFPKINCEKIYMINNASCRIDSHIYNQIETLNKKIVVIK